MRPPARLGCILGIALAVGSLLAVPATAWSKEEADLAFHLAGSNGYEIAVDGQSATAYLEVTRPSPPSQHRVESSTYVARGRVSATAIEAGFGELGSVTMRFHPSGRVVHGNARRNCRGPDRRTIRFGIFVGSVRFRGEDGYTSANVHRVKGTVTTPPSLSCSAPPAGTVRREGPRAGTGQRNPRTTALRAGWRLGLTATYFTAARTQGKARFLAVTEQSRGAFAVYRVVSAPASPLSFASDNALSFASVTPPPPFSGTGSLQRDSSGVKSWVGSLAVSFLGEPDVSLTGPQFKTKLTRNWSSNTEAAPALGSG